jgi:hypothetical protein
MSYYRQIRRPVAVFIDTIDEYFEGYVSQSDLMPVICIATRTPGSGSSVS